MKIKKSNCVSPMTDAQRAIFGDDNKVQTPKVEFKIIKNKEWEEWIVEVRIDGELNKEKSYHTDDKDDAISTKKAMEKELQEHPQRYLPEKKTKKSWDGYDIPKVCQDKNKECGKCYLEKEARTKIGCTVPVDETACEICHDDGEPCDACEDDNEG